MQYLLFFAPMWIQTKKFLNSSSINFTNKYQYPYLEHEWMFLTLSQWNWSFFRLLRAKHCTVQSSHLGQKSVNNISGENFPLYPIAIISLLFVFRDQPSARGQLGNLGTIYCLKLVPAWIGSWSAKQKK